MKIVIVYRKKKSGAHSIENLFHSICNELNKFHIDISNYEIKGGILFLLDIFNLWKMKCNVYHISGDINFLAFLLPRAKVILTVPDIGHYLYGLSGLKKYLYYLIWVLLPFKAAKILTTISKKSLVDINSLEIVSINKVTLIPACYDERFKHFENTFNSKIPRVLQVGTLPYKNVPNLIRGIRNIPCILVLVGDLSEEILTLLDHYKINFENYTNLNFNNLLAEYKKADIVSFISLGEGFGLPIIEAQALGRVVITSSIPPMSVVSGDGACLVDPLSADSIEQGFLRIINEKSYRDSLIRLGLNNCQKYTQEYVASRYLDLYKKIAKEN